MVIGFTNLAECLTKYENVKDIDLTPTIKESTILVQGSAKQLAPNNTGFTPSGKKSHSKGALKGSIRARMEKRYGGPAGIISTNLEYAPYVEFGTVKMKAQPYLRPAEELNRKTVIENTKTFMESKLKEIAK